MFSLRIGALFASWMGHVFGFDQGVEFFAGEEAEF
jgi:hypothetical protein